MVLDVLDNFGKYAALNPYFSLVDAFMRTHQLEELALGTYNIKGETEDLVKKYLSNEDYSAFGIMFFDRDNLSMKPYVYVKEVGSGVYENSCASGTTALGYYLKKYLY